VRGGGGSDSRPHARSTPEIIVTFITPKKCFNFTTETTAWQCLAGVCVFTVLASWLRRAPMSAAATRGLTASAAGLRAVLLVFFNAVRLLSSHDSE
jgi:hypothetical protein